MTAQTDLQYIHNRYQLQVPIGSGGMGIAYRAYDRLTHNTIALKKVLVEAKSLQFSTAARTEDPLVALAQEFQTLASLRHPNIISVLDFGMDDQGCPFYTMELLSEPTTIIEAALKAPDATRIELLTQLLEALIYLHRHGVVHHDLKPSNVLVSKGQVYVLDFGLSLKDISQPTHAGTAGYIAPEILRTGQVSFASDLYQVGVIAYEMFTQTLPFHPNDILGVMEEMPNLSGISDPKLAAVIGRLLAKKPEDRYPTAQAAQEAFLAVANLAPVQRGHLLNDSYLQAAPFVGRESELLQLLEVLADVQENEKSHLLLIGGESGVGKSRLLSEFRSHALVKNTLVLRGQAIPNHARAFEIWRAPLQHLLLMVPISELEAAILKEILPELEQLLETQIPNIAVLNGKEHEKRIADTIIQVIKRYQLPLVLILEDIHWAQDDLKLANRLITAAANCPLFIVASYQSDDLPLLPEIVPTATVKKLSRLSPNSIQELMVAMLGEIPRQNDLLQLIIRETEGNTFFIVEAVRALIEEMGYTTLQHIIELPQSLLTSGIRNLLTRRLERVPDIDYELLKIAALIGKRIDTRLLAYIAPSIHLNDWLYTCADAVVLEVDGNIWQFTHDKLRDVLVDSLPAHHMQDLYQQIAEATEIIYPDSEEINESLAHYWYQAGNDTKAADYAIQAGRFLDQHGYYARAKAVLAAGLEAATSADLAQQRSELLTRLGGIYFRISDHDQAYSLAQQGLELAQQQQDLALQGLALRLMGDARERQGAIQEGEDLIRQSLETCRAANDLRGIAYALYGLGFFARFHGKLAEALPYFEELLPIAEELEDKLLFTNTVMRMGAFHRGLGNFEKAATYNWRGLEMAQEMKYRFGEGVSRIMLGNLYHEMRNLLHAEEHYSQALPIFHELGDVYGIADCHRMLAMFAMQNKQFETALAHGHTGLELAHQMDSLESKLLALHVLGRIAVYISKYDEAEAHFKQMQLLCADNQDPSINAKVLSNFYFLAYTRRDYKTAYQLSQQALEVIRKSNQPPTIATYLVHFVLSCARTDRIEEGRIALAEAYNLIKSIPEIGIRLEILHGAVLLFSKTHPNHAMKWWVVAKNHPSIFPVQRDLIEQIRPTLEDILGEDAFYDALEDVGNYDVNEILEEVIEFLS